MRLGIFWILPDFLPHGWALPQLLWGCAHSVLLLCMVDLFVLPNLHSNVGWCPSLIICFRAFIPSCLDLLPIPVLEYSGTPVHKLNSLHDFGHKSNWTSNEANFNIKSNHWIWFRFHSVWFVTEIVETIKFMNWGISHLWSQGAPLGLLATCSYKASTPLRFLKEVHWVDKRQWRTSPWFSLPISSFFSVTVLSTNSILILQVFFSFHLLLLCLKAPNRCLSHKEWGLKFSIPQPTILIAVTTIFWNISDINMFMSSYIYLETHNKHIFGKITCIFI